MLRIVRISGSSMEPRLRSGDFAVFLWRPRFAVGDVVLVHHPALGPIVKQIRSLVGGECTLEGTGAFSTTSEKMGTVPIGAVKGKLLWHFAKPVS